MWSLSFLTLTLLLLLASNTKADTLEGCSAPFVPVGDQCLYFDILVELTYEEARQMCNSMDSELAIIDTATRFEKILDYIDKYELGGSGYWVDGSDQVTEGDWRYYSGQPTPMGTPFWKATTSEQQPDNADDGDCLQLCYNCAYYMNDVPCSNQYRIVCEKDHQLAPTEKEVQKVSCPPLFVDVGGLCLSFMTWEDQTWTEARQSCHGLTAELASVTDIETLRSIYLYLHQEGIADHSFWLGGSDEASEGIWTWIDGSPVPRGAPFWGYSSSYTVEPDGGSNENCLLLDAEGFHYFRDSSCDLYMNPLCQSSVP